MLIDYHIHLQSDDYVGPGPYPYTAERLLEYLNIANLRGIDELGITEHCNRFSAFSGVFRELVADTGVNERVSLWLKNTCYEDLDRYVGFLSRMKEEGLPVKIGIEVDYVPGKEDMIDRILSGYPWDFVLGSVHLIGTWAVDFSRDVGWPEKDVDLAFTEYLATLGRAAMTGLFDIMAHPDLIKKFGHRPRRDLSGSFETAAQVLKEAGVCIEVNSSGLRKPVGEIYPSQAFLRICRQKGVPIVLASDAHKLEEVGLNIKQAARWAGECGYTEVCTFEGRVRAVRPLNFQVRSRISGDS